MRRARANRNAEPRGRAGGERARAVLAAVLVGLGLWLALLVGCQTGAKQRSTSWMDRFRPFQGSTPSDAILLDVAVVEQPVLDPYLNGELWNLADEQGVPLERKGVLEDNGFRVGQVGGIVPPDLQGLLTSPRTCPNGARRIQTRTGTAKELTLGPVGTASRVWLHQEGRADELALERPEFQLIVTPSAAPDGRVCLRFLPQVRHGDPEHRFVPMADHSTVALQSQRPLRSFEELAWEVTVPANEYVVVGARGDKAGTLGEAMFIRRDEARPVQRLLVLRTARAQPGPAQEYGTASDEPEPRSPPLAARAATSVRGRGD
jgi:hypothetical protein